MDFGVLDGLVSSSENNKNSVISCGDSDLKTRCFGSEGEWRDLKMAKISEDDNLKTMLLQQQQRSNVGAYNTSMLSFSSPKAHSVAFPYYARNNTGYSAGVAGPFTPSQWMELEHQALIYKYITANAAIPSNLLIPIKKAFESDAYSGANLRQNPYGWGALRLGFYNSSDPEPGRCRRTDGKKWRCAKHAAIDQKYCERHMNRGRHRSRKHVEAQTCQSVTSAAKKTTVATVISQAKTQNTAASIQDNRPMLSSFVPLEKNQPSVLEEESHASEFGFVGSDSLLNPMHKSESKSQSSLHQFMEDWPHSTRAPTSERLDLSPLRMGKNTNRVSGGPLGEVLQHTTNNPSGLNM